MAGIPNAFILIGAVGALTNAAFAGDPPVAFTDEAAARGLVELILPEPSTYDSVFGRGLAFADLDGDGDPDLVTTGNVAGVIGLWENDGTGHFVNRNDAQGLPLEPWAQAASAADYDGDGDLDVLINIWNETDMLLRNDGDFQFTDVAISAGIVDDGPSLASTWGDYNGDGWVDLYLPHRTGSLLPPPGFVQSLLTNRLYRNNGDGTFTDVAGDLGVTDGPAFTLASCFFDMDRDGDQDLYSVNDKGPDNCPLYHNKLWRNDGGVFNDVSEAAGADGCMYAMCVAVGDFNRDLLDDLYVTNVEGLGNAMYLNQGDGVFLDSAIATGTVVDETGWGSVFLDYDNDTHMELYVCNVGVPSLDSFFDHDGVFPAADIAADVGLANAGVSYCVASADVDDDGDVDLAVARSGEPLKLYINNEGQRRNWIKLRVRGPHPNRFAIGTTVDVRTGSLWQTRQIIAGSNYKSQNELTVHFGLDDATMADEVVVRWPGGQTRSYADLAVNRTHDLRPTCRCDLTGDDALDVLDLLDYLTLWFTPAIDPAGADFDGTGQVADVLDLLAFLVCWFTDAGAC